MSVNKVILVGFLTKDPELKDANGTNVCKFGVATNESWTDKSGQKQERTEFHNIVAWGKTGELCAEYLSKGRQVYIEGKVQTRSWEGDDGKKNYMTEINAQSVQFLGKSETKHADTNKSDAPF